MFSPGLPREVTDHPLLVGRALLAKEKVLQEGAAAELVLAGKMSSAHHIRQQLESNLQEQQPLYSQLQVLQGQEKLLRRRLAEAEQAEKAAASGASSDGACAGRGSTRAA